MSSFVGHIHYSKLILGAKYPNESLNSEFKKFSFDKEDEVLKKDFEKLEDFFATGKIDQSINTITIHFIKEYIKKYVPKFSTSFFNMTDFLSLGESHMFIGIDDDGVISGIPFNFELYNFTNKSQPLISIIAKEVSRVLASNVVLHDYITFDELLSCIKPNIVFLEKSYHTYVSDKAKENHRKIAILEDEIQSLNKQKKQLEDSVFDTLIAANSVNLTALKENKMTGKDLLKVIIESDFEIKFDKENRDHEEFMFAVMKQFNSKQDYVLTYKTIIKSHPDIIYYINNKQLHKVLGTLLHEKVKIYSERIKTRLNALHNEEKQKLQDIKLLLSAKYRKFADIKYKLSSYVHLINSHNENKYFFIMINFDVKKYDSIILAKTHHKHLLAYINNKGERVVSKRGYKMVNNKLEPECYNVNSI